MLGVPAVIVSELLDFQQCQLPVAVAEHDVGEGLALPQWTIDEDTEQPATPWRYAPD